MAIMSSCLALRITYQGRSLCSRALTTCSVLNKNHDPYEKGVVVSGADKSVTKRYREKKTMLEKSTEQAKQTVNDNPFSTFVTKPEVVAGTVEGFPIIVPSTNDSRIVGCGCQHDYGEIVWFELKKGPPQKCDCGYYYKLLVHDPLSPDEKPVFGRGFGSGFTRYF